MVVENALVLGLFLFWGGAVVLAPLEMTMRRELLTQIQKYDGVLWGRLSPPEKGNLLSLHAGCLFFVFCLRPKSQTHDIELLRSLPVFSRGVVMIVKAFIVLGFFSGALLVLIKEGVLN